VPPERRLELATRALGLQPDLEAAYVVRALAHLSLGHDEAAYEDLGRAAERSPSPLSHWMNRADLARRLGRADDEISDLSRAIVLNPMGGTLRLQRAAASVQRARALLDEARPEDADRVARLVVQAGEDLAAAGSHALYDGVRRSLDEMLDRLPRVPAPLRRPLASAFSERAFAACPLPAPVARAADAACAADPSWAPALAARGLAAYLDGRDGSADAARALDLIPSLAEARAIQALSRLRKAAAAGDAVVFVDSAGELGEFLAHAPDKPALRPLRDLALAVRPEVPPAAVSSVTARLASRAAELRARGDESGARRLEDLAKTVGTPR